MAAVCYEFAPGVYYDAPDLCVAGVRVTYVWPDVECYVRPEELIAVSDDAGSSAGSEVDFAIGVADEESC